MGVKVAQKHAQSQIMQCGGQIHGGGGFPNAALLIHHGNYFPHVFILYLSVMSRKNQNVSRETSASLGGRSSGNGGVILPRQETVCAHVPEHDDGKNDQQHHTDRQERGQDTDAFLQRFQLFLRRGLGAAAGMNLL